MGHDRRAWDAGMTLTPRDQTFTLAGIMLALFLGALDQTIVSTALPKIVEDLEGLGRYAWVATAYLLASTSLVPIYGKLADMYSRRAIELWSVSVFLAGSFLCGIAGEFGSMPLLGDGMNQLIAFRAIQGMGAAVADLFPPSERGRYQGLIGATFGVASVLGPLVGGFLTDYAGGVISGVEGWRWVFYVNVPFGALALWFIVTRMPPLVPRGDGHGLDYPSGLFLIGGLVPFVLALQIDKGRFPWIPDFSTGATVSWESFVTLTLLLAAVASMTTFVFRSIRIANPLLDLGLFRNRVFSASNVAGFFVGASFLSVLIFLPLFIVNVVGVSVTRAGISLIPLSLGLVLGSTAAGHIVSRVGHYRRLLIGGGVVLLVGAVLLSRMGPDVGYWRVTAYMVICGLGIGPSFPLYPLAIQNAVDVRKVGQATSAAQFFRQIGGTVGAAVMGMVLATSLSSSFARVEAFGTFAHGSAAPERSHGRLAATGGANAAADIQAAFDRNYGRIERVVRDNDAEARALIVDDPQIPPQIKRRLQDLDLTPGSGGEEARGAVLDEIKTLLDEQAQQVIELVTTTTSTAIATATNRIYLFMAMFVVAAIVATLFIPEIPLRTTHDREV